MAFNSSISWRSAGAVSADAPLQGVRPRIQDAAFRCKMTSAASGWRRDCGARSGSAKSSVKSLRDRGGKRDFAAARIRRRCSGRPFSITTSARAGMRWQGIANAAWCAVFRRKQRRRRSHGPRLFPYLQGSKVGLERTCRIPFVVRDREVVQPSLHQVIGPAAFSWVAARINSNSLPCRLLALSGMMPRLFKFVATQ